MVKERERNPLFYGTVGAIIGGSLIWLVTSSAVNSDNIQMMRMMGMRTFSSVETFRINDAVSAHFIEQMIPHHEDAITMAQLALTNAKRAEIKELAQNIITAQEKEITDMRSWYKQWYGKDVPEDEEVMGMHGMSQSTQMHMGMMGDETDIEGLKNAQDFDKEFIEEMIPHHQMAVMMAQMVTNGTQKEEIKTLSENIIKTQTDEINQMRDWYEQWGYNESR